MTSIRRARLRWLGVKLRRRLVHEVCRRLYRDRLGGLDRTMVVAGCARSGTTWLADLLATRGRCRLMFEPFHSGRVGPFGDFPRFPYMRPADENDELLGYARRVLTGAIRHRWIDSRVESITPRFRLVKEIRANLFLKWMCDRFPEVRLLFLVRHPCAVVSSRLQLGWSARLDLDDMLSQETLVEDHLSERLEALHQAATPEEEHAAIWCIQNLVPLSQFEPDSLPVVFYERLCLQPKEELIRVSEILRQEPDEVYLSSLTRPSVTARPDSPIMTGEDRVEGWRKRLSSGQVERILRVVESFGLDYLYGDSPTPRWRSDRPRTGDRPE